MFFIVSKVLGTAILPLPLILLALVIAAVIWRRHPRLGRTLLVGALVVLWFLSSEIGSYLLLHPLEAPYEARPALSKVDAIVVLGGSLDLRASDPNRPALASASDRFFQGVLLARRYPGAYLVFSGGSGDLSGQGPHEAPMLQALAVQLGVPRDHIIAEDRSRNTRENATETKRALEKLRPASIVLITSAFHMRRAMECFQAVGLHPVAYAADFRERAPMGIGCLGAEPQRLADSTSAIREYIGLLIYHLHGYTGAPARR